MYGVHVSKVLARLTLRQRILLNAGLRKALVKFTTKSSKLLKTNQLRQAMLKTLLQRWIIKGAKTSKLETREAMAPVKRRFISTLKNEVISKRSKELDYSNFVEKGYVKHENNKQYNKVLADATSMTEDLPVFALDLYNLYLQNLESTDPVKLQKWVTKAYKNKTNKQYRKLLLDYTKLLKSFYNEVVATRIKKKNSGSQCCSIN